MLGLCALIHMASGVLVFGSRSGVGLEAPSPPTCHCGDDPSGWTREHTLICPVEIFVLGRCPIPFLLCVLEVGLLFVADFYRVASHLVVLNSSAMELVSWELAVTRLIHFSLDC